MKRAIKNAVLRPITASWVYNWHSNNRDEVARLHPYSCELPDNYLTKQEAMDLGWAASEGNLWEVTDQMSIGGDRFGNRGGLLPGGTRPYLL